MLEEAVAVIRLRHTGEEVSHRGTHYEVQEAKIYTLRRNPFPIYLSGFGPHAAELAGRIGDGYCLAMPDAELVKAFRANGGGHKPVQAGTKVSWDHDADAALALAHRLWANEALPGQLAQTLPRPKDFADAMTMVPQDTVVESVASGPDPDKHAQQVRQHLDAGVDEVYVQQIGPGMDGFFTSWQRDVLPQLKK
jgi:G6PDH family F420-dependent oxidoreductase